MRQANSICRFEARIELSFLAAGYSAYLFLIAGRPKATHTSSEVASQNASNPCHVARRICSEPPVICAISDRFLPSTLDTLQIALARHGSRHSGSLSGR